MTTSPPRRVGLLVGNPFRDLPSQVLTAMRLCQEGATALLIPSYLQLYEVWTLAPDFLLLENLRRDKKGLLRRLARAGIQAGVLDTEGGVFTDLESYSRKILPHPELLRTLAGFYSWGPLVARHLVAQSCLGDHQVAITGTPRMDLFTTPWRQAALRLDPETERFPRPLVLINGNFNMANPWLRSLDETVLEYLADGHDRDTILRWMEIQRRAMTEFIALARRLAARLPEVTFVYRPHPFERPEPYQDQFQGLHNLHLLKSGAIYPWILSACAVVQRGSSSAIEATLAGVPALAPSWVPCHLDLPSVEAVSLPCASEGELVDRLRSAAAGGLAIPAEVCSRLQGIISNWFCSGDGRSHERVAAAILEGSNGSGRVSIAECRRILEGVSGPRHRIRWRLRVRSWARGALGLPIQWSFRHWRDEPDLSWDHSQCYFGAEQVRSIAEALEPAARALYGDGWRRVEVRRAEDQGEYRFGYSHGRSIALTVRAVPGSRTR